MLGWIFSIVTLIVGFANKSIPMLVISALYAIAGSISWAAYTLLGLKNDKKKTEQDA